MKHCRRGNLLHHWTDFIGKRWKVIPLHAQQQAGVGAKLACTQRNWCSIHFGNLFRTFLQGWRKEKHRISTAHFRKHGDWFFAFIGHVKQRFPATIRPGKTNRLCKRMHHQCYTDLKTFTLHMTKGSLRHFSLFYGPVNALSNKVWSLGMSRMSFHNHRAPGCQGWRRIATSRWVGKWEIAGAKNYYGTNGHQHFSNIRFWKWRPLGLCCVDPGINPWSLLHKAGKHAQLSGCTGKFTR